MWSVTFLSSWVQRQNELKFLWGSEGFEKNERTRPQFRGSHRVNQETGREIMMHDHVVLRYFKLSLSMAVSFACICTTIYWAVLATKVQSTPPEECQCCVMSEYIMAENNITVEECDALKDSLNLWEKNRFRYLSSLLNLVLIFVAGTIYEFVATILTNWCVVSAIMHPQTAVKTDVFVSQGESSHRHPMGGL